MYNHNCYMLVQSPKRLVYSKSYNICLLISLLTILQERVHNVNSSKNRERSLGADEDGTPSRAPTHLHARGCFQDTSGGNGHPPSGLCLITGEG